MFRIPKIHLLVFRAFLGPFAGSFSVALFILVLQFLAKYQQHIFGKGFGAWVIVQLFGFATVKLVTLALPLALLMASLMTMGGLGERYELAAMKSGGISLFRAMRSIILFGVVCAGFSLYLGWQVIPYSNLKLYALLYDVKQAKPEFTLQKGYFDNSISGFTIYFSDQNPSTGTIYNIKIWDHSDAHQSATLTFADSATVKIDPQTQYLRLTLFHGETHEEVPPKQQAQKPGEPPAETYVRFRFDTTYYKLDLSGFGLERTSESWFQGHRYVLTVPELKVAADSVEQLLEGLAVDLNRHISTQADLRSRLGADSLLTKPLPQDTTSNALYYFDTLRHKMILDGTKATVRNAVSYLEYATGRVKKEREEMHKFRAEMWMHFVLASACLVFLFIGAPFGAIVRKGNIGLPTVFAVIFFILFYVLNTQGQKLVREDILIDWVGFWLSILVLAPIAFYLTYQSATDSQLFDISAWRKTFRVKS